jgi:phytoene dehydrogenase-like protein
MGSITQLMKIACEEKGVEISTNAPVEKILIKNNKANGVVLEDGTQIFADKVISNLNPKLLFKKLVDENDVEQEYRRKILNYKCGSGTFRMNVALSELPDFNCIPGKEISEHHKSGIVIAPTLTYMDRAFTDAKQYGWSKNPIVEMLIPSTVDSTLAPEGKHVASLFCQQFAPTLPDNKSWHDEKANAANTIIETVNKFAPNFKESILGMSILSPLDLEEKLGLVGGDIMHGVMSLDQMWAARPVFNYGDYKTPVKNLFICGSGSHPGGGVTGLPGKNSAREILRSK